MRFSMKNYEKAFPRSEKKTTKVEVASSGNVIEEAEQQIKKPAEVPEEPGNVIEQEETPVEEGGGEDGDE